MNIEVVKQEKDDVELKIDNPTAAEILRVYLNKNGVKFAAWRREHPSKPLIMKIQDANVKKAVGDAIADIAKDLNEFKAVKKK